MPREVSGMTALNRRALLKGFGATAITAGISSRSRSSARALTQDTGQSDTDFDVAIVGGGVSGAYCAWRLAQEEAASSAILRASGVSGAPSVALFEASDRIGGRLWSFEPPGMPHLRAELGGMRIPTNQKLVIALVERLGIETIPFPMGDQHNLRYLRGRRFTVADLGNPDVVPYDLPPELRGKTPDDIAIQTIERYIPNARSLKEADWDEVRRSASFEGVPLYDLSFRYLMQRDLTDEAYQFVRDDAPVEDLTLNASAADLMFDWGCKRFRAHSSARPRRTVLRFTRNIGCAASFPSPAPAQPNPDCDWRSRSFRTALWRISLPATSSWPCRREPFLSSLQTACR
jgi:hypothetical protein